MKKLILTLLVAAASASAIAQQNDRPDGTIVEDAPCPAIKSTYEQYLERLKVRYDAEIQQATKEGFRLLPFSHIEKHLQSKASYERRLAFEGFECRTIKYWSDGLKIGGLLWKPKNTEGRKLPLVIVNRGGARDFGVLSPAVGLSFHDFLDMGFVVLASQYRGNSASEGKEQYGGDDVNDILNLMPLAKSLGYVDTRNTFMYGISRGGMMTYIALKRGMEVNAVAVHAGDADLEYQYKRRPLLGTIYAEILPGFVDNREAAFRERSAIYWPEKINVPVMLLHGTADWRVDPQGSLAMAQKLEELKKPYELIMFADDDHGLWINQAEALRSAGKWFRKHMKQEAK
jgi:dipeptidyl aminopeptidase/acylaminoacyl peptidase